MKLRRRALTVLSVVALIASVFATAASAATSTAARGDDAIRLQTTTFRPQRGEMADVPAHLRVDRYLPGQRGLYIVQFDGPILDSWRAAVEAEGAELLGYLPDFAYKVRMTPAEARNVAGLDATAWVGFFHPAYKIDPAITAAGDGVVRVDLERGANVRAIEGLIAATGAQVLTREGAVLTIAADRAQIDAIAGIGDVAWISDFKFFEKHNEFGAGVILGANTANAAGYDGSTQTVAVADTGIGDGSTSPHVDVNGRVTAVFDWPTTSAALCYDAFPDGAQDVDSGHGTHTALSVLSDGSGTGQGKGTAPAANLVFQAVEDYIDTFGFCAGSPDGYYLTGLPDDLTDLYQEAYNAGARIHSNSWGSSVAGDYTADSATTDDFMWTNPDMLITFSAGNSGIDANNNGVVDDDSIGSPATAKNVLTVGASENDRADNFPCDTSTASGCTGVNDIFTYGSAWPTDFPVDPLNSDPSAGNAEQMAAFSSRGPTDDGRIKPDVVAPGTWVLSGFSDLYQEFYDGAANPQNGAWQYDGWGLPLNDEYKYMGGTSMSNPLAAGAAAVVRDFYEKAEAHSASAALTKATLINSAVDMLDENNDGADDNDFPIPNSHEGWGRIDVAAATDGSAEWVDAAGVSTGGTDSYAFAATAGSAFKVTLAYTDFPSTETAAVNLVNDLDLVVTAPDGTTTYLGNVFSSGWSTTGGSADRTNNVENVYIQSAQAGTYTVDITGFNVPFGPQPYALVVDGGATGPVDNPPTVTITAPADGATVSGTITVTTTSSDDNGVSSVEVFVDGASAGFDTGAGVDVDTTLLSEGGHTISATATDTIGQTATDTISVTVDNVPSDDPPTVTITAPADGATVSGTITVTTTSSDDNGVSSVEVFVDGASIGFDTGSGVSFDTTTVADGAHTISATATDTIGQTATDTISVTVDNPDPVDDPPTVTIDSPANRATVSGVITIETTATDDIGVVSVELFLNNSSIGFDTGSGVVLDTTTLVDRGYRLEAVATDTGGQTGSDTIRIVVDNSSVDNPPTVTITAPADGATVSGTITVATTSSDDNGVSSVEVFVDGASIGFDTGSGVSFDTTTVADGAHTISATATDTIGQTATDTISVTVDNSTPPDDPPTVTITAPADGATVSGTITVTTTSSDDNGVSSVEVFVDGASAGFDTGAGVDVDTTLLSEGAHTISATATDTIGQTATDTISVTVDNVAGGTDMHVGDLDGVGFETSTNRWQGTVTVTVHDDSEAPVSDATVELGYDVRSRSFTLTCVTNASGECSVTSRTVSTQSGALTFTVVDVTHATLTYDAAVNHDPDGDSDGTTIVVDPPGTNGRPF